ncbi:MAG: hypothetical protein P4L81_08360 [Candidatus Pacebacteria bacterium]|nr:hypothetical protein [Candidatus Paceibacterota bacterium]
MDEFAKMDIFFVVTTIVTAVMGIGVALILYRIWAILGHVQRFAELMNHEAELVSKDLAELRESVSTKGFRMRYLVRFFKGTFSELMGMKD